MNKKDLIKLFEDLTNNKSDMNVFQIKLLEIIIILNDNTKLYLLYNEDIQFIDISGEDIGLGGFIIDPISNIKSIEVKKR